MADGSSRAPVIVATVLPRTGTVGVQTHVSQVVDLLTRIERPVHVVDPGSLSSLFGPALLLPGRALRRAGFATGVELDRYWHRRFLQSALSRAVRNLEPAVVYAQDPRSAYAALRVRGSAAVPVVLAVHYNVSQAAELVDRQLIRAGGRTDRAIRAFEAAVIDEVDGLVFVSDFMRQQVFSAVPAARRLPSVVIPNFMEDPPAAESTSQLADCVTVGNLLHRKNHSYLLQVLAAAKRQGHSYSLSVVGDGPEREPLEKLTSHLGLSQQVQFLGARFDVHSLLPRHRLYVHSARMENFPFALIEALAAGLPVVAAPVGGIPEVVGTDGAGSFWDLDDPEAGAEVLVGLAEDRARMLRASRTARTRFLENFTPETAGAKLLEELDSLVRISQ